MSEAGTAAPAASTETAAPSLPGFEAPAEPAAAPAEQNGKEPAETAPAPLSDDWRAVIDEPSLRELADRITGPKDVLKIIADLRKANGSMVKLPGKDAKPEEVEKFRKAVGAGTDEAAYLKAFSVPEGAQANEFVQDLHTKLAGVFLKHNASLAVATESAEIIKQADEALETENNRIALKGREDSLAELRKEWGADFEANFQGALRLRAKYGSPEGEAFFDNTHINGKKLGDHPEVIRIFGTLSRRFGGAEFVGPVNAEETNSIQGRINEIFRQHPVGTPEYGSAAVQRELTQLHEKLHGTQPIVGRGRPV